MEKKRMEESELFDIEFYMDDKLPEFLREEAKKQNIEIKKGIIAVETIIASNPQYEFIMLENKLENFRNLFYQLAKKGGIDLDKALEHLSTIE